MRLIFESGGIKGAAAYQAEGIERRAAGFASGIETAGAKIAGGIRDAGEIFEQRRLEKAAEAAKWNTIAGQDRRLARALAICRLMTRMRWPGSITLTNSRGPWW